MYETVQTVESYDDEYEINDWHVSVTPPHLRFPATGNAINWNPGPSCRIHLFLVFFPAIGTIHKWIKTSIVQARNSTVKRKMLLSQSPKTTYYILPQCCRIFYREELTWKTDPSKQFIWLFNWTSKHKSWFKSLQPAWIFNANETLGRRPICIKNTIMETGKLTKWWIICDKYD